MKRIERARALRADERSFAEIGSDAAFYKHLDNSLIDQEFDAPDTPRITSPYLTRAFGRPTSVRLAEEFA